MSSEYPSSFFSGQCLTSLLGRSQPEFACGGQAVNQGGIFFFPCGIYVVNLKVPDVNALSSYLCEALQAFLPVPAFTLQSP